MSTSTLSLERKSLSLHRIWSSAFWQWVIKIAKVFVVSSLTLFPILRIVYILAINGVNNLSVDDIMIAPLIDKIMSGGYSWINIFHDTFINGHMQLFPILAHLFFARFLSWNVYPILFFGVLLTILKLFLLFDLFTYLCRYSFRWILLPILSFLLFAPSQLSVFEFEFPAMQMGFCYLGVIFGLWSLVRFKNKWLGVILMSLGGIIASGSWATGILSWPVFLLALILLGIRRIEYYAIWLWCLILSAMPYIYFLLLNPVSDLYTLVEQRAHGNNLTFVSLLNVPFIIKALGWPLSNGFSLQSALWRGGFGILLLITGIFLFLTKRRELNFEKYVPPFLILVFALLNIWEISLFRWYMAQWYALPFMFFWIGLAGLGYTFCWNRQAFTSVYGVGYNNLSFAAFLWSELVLVIVILFFLTSNLTYADKSFYLQTRSPASASCLRNYATAPTYCEPALFLWPPGQFQLLSLLAQPLERHQLSVFAPHQRWILQGDFILGNVKIHEIKDIPEIFWTTDLSVQHETPFTDYRHLNLFLHSPNSVEWTVTIPKNTKKAEFWSAIAISQSAPHEAISDGVIFKVEIAQSGRLSETIFNKKVDPNQRDWIPFNIPLEKFAGQTITLILTSDIIGNNIHDWAMYRYPFIDIDLNPSNSNTNENKINAPSNTDLSSSLPLIAEKDFIFKIHYDGQKRVNQKGDSVKKSPWEGTWLSRMNNELEYKTALNLNLSDYSHLQIKAFINKDVYPRAFRIQMLGPSLQKTFIIPLLSDEMEHTYTYDLKNLELKNKNILTNIKVDLSGGRKDQFNISEIRLIWGQKHLVSAR